MILTGAIKKLIPRKYHLPISYFKHKFKHALEPEMEFLPDLIGTGQRAIDVGANRGLYTYALSKICSKVEAFEPVPQYFAALNSYHANNVTAHNIALSNKNGVMWINVPSGNNYGESPSFIDLGYEATRIEVPIRALDEYHFSHVSFIKIDVEGYESEVLNGAEQTIRENRPVLLIEIEQRHIQSPITEVFDQILNRGYRGYFYRNGELVDIAAFSYQDDQEPYLSKLEDGNYINNFIFRPK